jgi:hypothetical protein
MGATEPRGPVDENYETACAPLRHPLRVRILEVANTREISPVAFVDEQLQPEGMRFKSRPHALSHVSYHFRELESAGCIEVVRTVQRRGAIEHIYRGTIGVVFTTEEFAELPLQQRRILSRTAFQGLIARGDGAMRAGTFDARTDRHLVWMPMELDERAWTEFTTVLDSCFAEVQRIHNDARNRLAGSGDRVIPATYGMFGFESPPPPLPPSDPIKADELPS